MPEIIDQQWLRTLDEAVALENSLSGAAKYQNLVIGHKPFGGGYLVTVETQE
ncbi:MAG TPA: hypothetical protein VGG75_38220 [Trebonia sp.]|jgi:hypothetical protein